MDEKKWLEILDGMKKDLIDAKKIIVKQSNLLNAFNTPPFLQGIVIGITDTRVDWKEFTRGKKVRIRRDSKFAHQN